MIVEYYIITHSTGTIPNPASAGLGIGSRAFFLPLVFLHLWRNGGQPVAIPYVSLLRDLVAL